MKKAAKKKKVANVATSDSEPQNGSFGWEDKVPEPVAEKADLYVKAMRAKNKAAEKAKAAKDAAIDAMKAHNITKMRIDEGQQWLICEEKSSLKTQKVNKTKDEAVDA